jgi:hypothetical protein
MYKLDNFGIKTFRTAETVNFIVYVLLVIIMILLKSFGDYYWLKDPKLDLKRGTV